MATGLFKYWVQNMNSSWLTSQISKILSSGQCIWSIDYLTRELTKYSETLLSRTESDYLKTSTYQSIQDIEGEIL